MKKWVRIALKDSKDGVASLSFNYEGTEPISDGNANIGMRFTKTDLFLKELGHLVDIDIPNHNISYLAHAEVKDAD